MSMYKFNFNIKQKKVDVNTNKAINVRTVEHNKLNNLDYEHSGHTGFASQKELESISKKVITDDERAKLNSIDPNAAEKAVSTHNTSSTAHSDIRTLVSNAQTTADNAQTKANEIEELIVKNGVIDGSPRGVYANLSALQTAYPSGASGVYLTSDNGHWYYWNGTTWTDGGVYQSSEDIKQIKEDLQNLAEPLQDGRVCVMIDNSKLAKGYWSAGLSIDTPTANNYTGVIKAKYPFDNLSTVELIDTSYKITFAPVNDSGIITKDPSTWIENNTVITKSEIFSNCGATNENYFAIQIRHKDGSAVDFTNARVSDILKIYKFVVAEGSVTFSKLSKDIQDTISNFKELKTKRQIYLDGYVERGILDTGDTLDAELKNKFGSYYTFRKKIPIDDSVYVLTQGYKVCFSSCNDENTIDGTPSVWLTDSEITPQMIRTNTTIQDAKYFVARFANIDGSLIPSNTNISSLLKYRDEYKNIKVSEYNIPNNLIAEEKLDANVRAKLNRGSNDVDLIMFMGQSNMAGRGTSADAPAVIDGAGYEYRAISNPNHLVPMVEPFGATENNPTGINEGSAKTGSMVSAFTNAYYTNNGNVPVVGISASKGGTKISEWQPGGAYLDDAIARLSSCVSYLTANNYTIRHKYILWCQGESDGDDGTTAETYKTLFNTMFSEMKTHGIEKLFIVRIGNYNSGSSTKYDEIMNCQTNIAQTEKDVIMASTDLAGMRERGLMKDTFHYYQAGYNEVGEYAGINTAVYATTGKEPTMYDTKDNSLYYTHKN